MNQRELTREEKDILYTKIAMLPEMDPIDILNAIEKRSQIKDGFKQTLMSAISKALFNNMVWDDEYLASLDIQEHDYKIFEKMVFLKFMIPFRILQIC